MVSCKSHKRCIVKAWWGVGNQRRPKWLCWEKGEWIKKLDAWTKSRQPKAVRIELRAGGDLHSSEKPRWSAGDMDKYPRKMLRHPVSPKGILQKLKVKSSHLIFCLAQICSKSVNHRKSSHSKSNHPYDTFLNKCFV